jgi:5'-3' exonuclease
VSVPTHLLIDGDQYLYRSAAAAEHDVRWDDENHVLTANEIEVWDTVRQSLDKVFKHFGTTAHTMAMGEGPYFRHKLAPDYKKGRTRKPLCFYDVRTRMQDEYNVVTLPGIEADDIMGILATKPNNFDKIIVCRDKDLKQIPGKLWDGKKFKVITEQEADYWHLYQTLVGDSSDGYKGCPGVGPKKAEAILKSACADDGQDAYVWSAVVATYEKAKLTEADALLQARLARILRWSDWDSKKKEPILWEPPSHAQHQY